MAQWLACWAHNPKVRGSKPRSAMLEDSPHCRQVSGLHGAQAPCSGPQLPVTELERRRERSPYAHPAPTPVTPARAEVLYLQGRGSCETKTTRVWAFRARPEVSLPDASWGAVAGARTICSRCRQRARAHQSRQCVRAVKEMDSKSIGLCPQGFESPRCRFACSGKFIRHAVWLMSVATTFPP